MKDFNVIKPISVLAALSLLLVPIGVAAEGKQNTNMQQQKNQEKIFTQEELDLIDKKADEVWVKSKGDKDAVKAYLESVGIKHLKREVTDKKTSSNGSTQDVSIQSTAYYRVYMDFYRVDAYKVKVWAYMENTGSGPDTYPSSKDRLGMSWDAAIQNKSSEAWNFYSYLGYDKSVYTTGVMAKAESSSGALAYWINDGPLEQWDYVKSAYIQLTFSDPKNAIGTGPYTTYYARYKHTYGSGTTSWSVGYPWTIQVSGSTQETIDDYADDLAQYAP